MKRYNYRESVKEDVKDYISENFDLDEWTDRERLTEVLEADMWIADSVTGSASGSTWKAEEYLCHNWDLLEEAMECLGDSRSIFEVGPKECDATIRRYLLPEIINEVLNELFLFQNFDEE